MPQSLPLKKLPRGTAIQRATLASGAASAAAASAAAAAATLTQGVVYAASGAKRHKTGDGAFSSLAGEDAEGLLGTLCTDMVRMAAKARHAALAAEHGGLHLTEGGGGDLVVAAGGGGGGDDMAGGGVHLAFSAMTIVEALPSLISQGKEERLLPVLHVALSLIDRHSPSAYAHAGMLITTQMAARAPLSPAVSEAVSKRLAAAAVAAPTPALAGAPLLALAFLSRHAYATAARGTTKASSLAAAANVVSFDFGSALVSHDDDDAPWSAVVEAFASLSETYDLSLVLPGLLASLHAHAPATDADASRLLSLPRLSSADGAATLATLFAALSASDAAANRRRKKKARKQAAEETPTDEGTEASPASEGGVGAWLANLLGLRAAAEAAEAADAVPALDSPVAAKRLLAVQELALEAERKAAAEAAGVRTDDDKNDKDEHDEHDEEEHRELTRAQLRRLLTGSAAIAGAALASPSFASALLPPSASGTTAAAGARGRAVLGGTIRRCRLVGAAAAVAGLHLHSSRAHRRRRGQGAGAALPSWQALARRRHADRRAGEGHARSGKRPRQEGRRGRCGRCCRCGGTARLSHRHRVCCPSSTTSAAAASHPRVRADGHAPRRRVDCRRACVRVRRAPAPLSHLRRATPSSLCI